MKCENWAGKDIHMDENVSQVVTVIGILESNERRDQVHGSP
jgi:hypothetical protein